MTRTCIVNIGQLVTPTPSGWEVSVTQEDLLIEEGKITGIGGILPDLGDIVIDANGGAVLPGFVDAHTHLGFGGSRLDEFARRAAGETYQEIAASGGGIRASIEATRAMLGDVGSGLAHIQRQLNRHHRMGTTTVEGKTGYALRLNDEIRLLKLYRDAGIIPTFLGLHAVPPEFHGDREGFVREVCEVWVPAVAGLAKYVDAFIEPGYFTHDDARQLAVAARKEGLDLRLHVDQITESGGAQLAAELGAVTADHLEQTTTEGILALAAAGVQPVLLPASVLLLGASRYPNARAMIEAGLEVVLATDFNPGSSPTVSMPLIITLAMTQMKMSAEECLVASTRNAAKSLGLHDRGRIAPGQRADLAIWPVKDWREIAYWAGEIRPSCVIVGGDDVT
ncbi:MAG: imidazolonepropionase [Armatimonadetes bacterium]|nr:imidazolonepropionase [Armatimonadota bacterium]